MTFFTGKNMRSIRSIFKRRSAKLMKPARQEARRSFAEALEGRVLLSNSTLATAQSLGVVTSSTVASGSVTTAAPLHYYKFSVAAISDVTLSVGWTTGYGRLQLIKDANNNGLIDSGEVYSNTGYNGGNQSFHQRLFPGTYYAEIANADANDAYHLTINAVAAPADPGNTLTAAKDLGLVTAAKSVTTGDWVGSADGEDDFKFTIDSIRDVTLSVGWTVGYGRLQLVNDANNNGFIDSGEIYSDTGYNGGNQSFHQRLFPGTYYAHINNADTNDFYNLTINAPAAPADPGNSLSSAQDLGTVTTAKSVTTGDWVGSADGEDDFKFTIDSIRDVTLSVAWTTGYGRLQLVNDANNNLLIDSGEVYSDTGYNGGNQSFHQRLFPGTYYAHINNADTNDFYNLTINAPAAPADPGNSLGAAQDLGTVTATKVVTTGDWVGSADGEDDFKFTIDSIRDVTLSVGWTTGYGRLQLVNDANNNLLIDSGEVYSDTGYNGGNQSFHQRLFPGTYYARVNNADTNDFYNLTINAPTAPADPGNSLGAAKDLGPINGTINTNDWVGSADGEDDYQFNVASTRTVTLSVNWTKGYGRLQLIHDANHNGLVDNGEVLGDTGYNGGTQVIQQQLTPGTYFLRINNADTDDFYALNLTSPVVQTKTVSVTATDASASFATADPGVFTISRTGDLTAALTVSYTLTGTAKNGTDYVLIPSTALIPAGKSSVAVTLTPKTGGSKPAETAILTLTATSAYVVNTTKVSATINIQSNTLPVIGIVATDPDAAESAAGPTSTGDFTLSRSATAGSNIVTFAVAGTAVYGTDYTLAVYGASTFSYNATTKVLTVTLAAGQSAASILVTPINHAVTEAAVTVLLTLQSNTGFGIATGHGSATVTIAAHG